jgi:hypothetical protein
MTTLNCSHEGCKAVFLVIDMPLHPSATYTCKIHTEKAPDKVRFQTTQFDKEIDRKQ